MKSKSLKLIALLLTGAIAVTGVLEPFNPVLAQGESAQEESIPEKEREDVEEERPAEGEPEETTEQEGMGEPENSKEPENDKKPENDEKPENGEELTADEKPETGEESAEAKEPGNSQELKQNEEAKEMEEIQALDAVRTKPTAEEAFAALLQENEMYAVLNCETQAAVYQWASYDAAQAAVLPSGHQVKLTGAVVTDTGIWYQVSFAVNEKESTGFVPEDYVVTADSRLLEWKRTCNGSGNSKAAGTGVLEAQRATNLSAFPASYRSYIQALMNAHPTWTFVPMNTGLKWSDVIQNEMVNARNLVPVSYPLTWKSTASEDYQLINGKWDWVIKNGTTWVQASESIVRFYLDPRNFLNEISVFQYEQLTFNASCHNEAGVEAILAGTFMSHKVLEDGSGGGITYAQAFMQIGKELNVSPYFLASRVRQEQGTGGTSALISGTVSGYAGYYNYFNMGATGIGNDVIISGMNEAVANGWNSRYAALRGGAGKVTENYISKGQDTLYLQKFDVDSSYHGLYWHQYMQNLQAADNESKMVRSSYQGAGAMGNSFVFKVPVYKNMPGSACAAPGTKLGTPTLKVFKNGYASTKLSWSESLGAQAYEVYRASSKNGTYTKIADINGLSNTSYEDKSIQPGKRYYYKVCGFMNYNGVRSRSAYSSIKETDYRIAATSLTKTRVKNYTTVDLAWKKVSVSGYKIYRKKGSGKYTAVKTIKGSSTISYQDKTLEPNQTYTYKIRTYKTINGKNYYSSYSSEKKISTKIAAGQMEAVSASGGNKVKLIWKRDSKANGYVIYRAASEKGSYKRIKTITGNKTVSYSDAGVTTGTKYFYKVRSYAKAGKSTKYGSYSNILMASTRLTKPTVTSVSASSSIRLKWKKSSNAAGYKIYRADSYSGKYKAIKTITKNSTVSYTDKSVTLGKVYYYKVRAYAKFGKTTKYSSYSAVVCAQPELSETQISSIYSIGTTSLKLKWEKVSDAAGYKIYRKTGKNGKYTCVKTISKASTTAWKNSGLKKGTNYYYKIRAYKKVNGKTNYSSYSSEWAVQTKK